MTQLAAAEKLHLDGTHRTVPPAETFRRLLPILPRVGITRVGVVTGLDVVGIPVVMVCRPNGRSLSVSQGKGADLIAAKVSGIMEALEGWHAEHILLPLRLATYRELREVAEVVDVEQLPRPSWSRFHPDLSILWIEGTDVIGGGRIWVPYECVHLDFRSPGPQGTGCFLANGTGLAAGNHVLEAVSHALCEVVERDAFALWDERAPADRVARRIDLDTITDPGCRALLDTCERAGVGVAASDLTTDVGLPVFSATIVDRRSDVLRRLPAAIGGGSHPDRGIALSRALTEAAQSRLTLIAGSRDDCPPEPLPPGQGHAGDRLACRLARPRRGTLVRGRGALSRRERRRRRDTRARPAACGRHPAGDPRRSHTARRRRTRGPGGGAGPRGLDRQGRAADPRCAATRRADAMTAPVVIFLGPTLSPDDGVRGARRRLPSACRARRPPAGGVPQRPRAIGLVDGLFERVPAVWHKEILFALSEGVHVYGAASMGALRAAELDAFGMRGVGDVYRAYADGSLEDDDEVAVAHADAAHGFRALSDAMVDVRATLDAAVAAGVIRPTTAESLVARIKATFYAERVLVAALARDDEEHERLRAWLPTGKVERKRDDAIALLEAIRRDLESGLDAFRPAWTLQRTRYWEDARRSIEVAGSQETGRAGDATLEAVLDEARLDPDGYGRLVDAALLAALARNAAAGAGVDVSPWAHQAALTEDRRARGLLEPEDVDAWLAERELDRDDLPDVARRLAILRWARDAHRDALAGEVALAVRSDEAFPALADRAERKRRLVASLPSDRPTPADDELVAWYFRERLDRDVPVALDAWAAAHDWRRVTDLLRALRDEWWFRASHEGEIDQAHGGAVRAARP